MFVKKPVYIFILVLFISACQKEVDWKSDRGVGTVAIHFQHTVNDKPLNFADTYVNDWAETYTVNQFKYYIHDIKLLPDGGDPILLAADYFLVDEKDPPSLEMSFSAPAGKYVSLQYTLGVDSVRNVSGAQTGALDPGKGMFWTWASGYVMAKLEGHSDFSTGIDKTFTYHVGGFKSPNSVIKTITLPVATENGLSVETGRSVKININADINKWFSYKTQLKIADQPSCHSPGELAKQIADNYEAMFVIESIE